MCASSLRPPCWVVSSGRTGPHQLIPRGYLLRLRVALGLAGGSPLLEVLGQDRGLHAADVRGDADGHLDRVVGDGEVDEALLLTAATAATAATAIGSRGDGVCCRATVDRSLPKLLGEDADLETAHVRRDGDRHLNRIVDDRDVYEAVLRL